MASCPLPVAESVALVGRCEEAQKRKPCSSTQAFAYWSFLKDGVKDGQQHCQGATGCCPQHVLTITSQERHRNAICN